jgi:acyl carrier protein
MEKLLKVLLMAKPVLSEETFLKANDLYGEGLLDSLDILIVVDELNAAYEIEIDRAGFSRDDFKTLTNILELVKRHGGQE